MMSEAKKSRTSDVERMSMESETKKPMKLASFRIGIGDKDGMVGVS